MTDKGTRSLFPAPKHGGPILDGARDLIREMWPARHDYFGVRLTLRSVVRHARRFRDTGKA